jgi:hypothetical protein
VIKNDKERFVFKSKQLAVLLAAPLVAIAGCALANSDTLAQRYKPQYTRASDVTSIPAPEGQLKDQLNDLKNKALGGNAYAAAEIYAGLGRCSTLARANDTIRFDAYCKGITKSDVDEQSRWLVMAAQMGNAAAQYSFAAGGIGQMSTDPQYALKHPEAVKVYRDQARRYLEGLASQCNVSAIATIADDASTDGFLYGDDPSTGYKYQVALNTIRNTPDASKEAALQAKVDPQKVFSLRRDALFFVNQRCQ